MSRWSTNNARRTMETSNASTPGRGEDNQGEAKCTPAHVAGADVFFGEPTQGAPRCARIDSCIPEVPTRSAERFCRARFCAHDTWKRTPSRLKDGHGGTESMVKLTVKTIKGKKFQIEVEQTQTVSGNGSSLHAVDARSRDLVGNLPVVPARYACAVRMALSS